MVKIKQGERPKAKGTSHTVKANVLPTTKDVRVTKPGGLSRKPRSR